MQKARCRKCEACKRVEKVKAEMFRVLADGQVKGRSNAEDVRLVWNRTLEENPCSGEPQKTTAWVGSAWYRDCDPFMGVIINPNGRFGKTALKANAKLERLALEHARWDFRSADYGEDETLGSFLDSVCTSGCFLEDIELTPEQLSEFKTSGFCYAEGF